MFVTGIRPPPPPISHLSNETGGVASRAEASLLAKNNKTELQGKAQLMGSFTTRKFFQRWSHPAAFALA